MICPYCGTHVPDSAGVCPACHADLAMTRAMPKLQGTYCQSCGALVPAGESFCPSCGMPVGRRPAHVRRAVSGPVAEDGEDDAELAAEDTHAMPRIESAIPSENDVREGEYRHDRMPRTRVVAVAAIASLLIVGGVTLAITHPWDPSATYYSSSRATTDADTSYAGFPGAITSLVGQDSSVTTTSSSTTLTGDEATYSSLSNIYDQLNTIASELDDNQSTFDDVAFGSDLAARVSGKNAADSISIEISNLITSLGQVDVSSGTYSTDATHLNSLGNWLRNRADGLTEAWALDVSSSDPESERSTIEAPLTRSENSSGENAYKVLFDENYSSWAVTEK